MNQRYYPFVEQLYTNCFEVKVTSEAHGERIWILPAKSFDEAIVRLRRYLDPWASDEDLYITVKPHPAFIFIPEGAVYGENSPIKDLCEDVSGMAKTLVGDYNSHLDSFARQILRPHVDRAKALIAKMKGDEE